MFLTKTLLLYLKGYKIESFLCYYTISGIIIKCSRKIRGLLSNIGSRIASIAFRSVSGIPVHGQSIERICKLICQGKN